MSFAALVKRAFQYWKPFFYFLLVVLATFIFYRPQVHFGLDENLGSMAAILNSRSLFNEEEEHLKSKSERDFANLEEQVASLQEELDSINKNINPNVNHRDLEVLAISRIRDMVASMGNSVKENFNLMYKRIDLVETKNKEVIDSYRQSLNWVYMLFVAALFPQLLEAFRDRPKKGEDLASLESEVERLKAELQRLNKGA